MKNGFKAAKDGILFFTVPLVAMTAQNRKTERDKWVLSGVDMCRVSVRFFRDLITSLLKNAGKKAISVLL